jgi:Putative addiction module component
MRAVCSHRRTDLTFTLLEAEQIRRMSMAERLQALEELWNSVCRDESTLPSPAWHGEVLHDRKTRAERGEARFLTLDELKARLRATPQ